MNRQTEQIIKKGIRSMRDGELARAYVDVVRRTDDIYADGAWEHKNDYSELELLLLEEMADRYVKEHVLHD